MKTKLNILYTVKSHVYVICISLLSEKINMEPSKKVKNTFHTGLAVGGLLGSDS